jgi:hypothetical protein
VAEAIDVRGVGVDVLAQGVRVLEQQAERFGIVGGLQGAERGEHGADLAPGARGLVRRARTENEGIEQHSDFGLAL